MFVRVILIKGSAGTSSFKDTEAHVTKTKFGSSSFSKSVDTKVRNREPCPRHRAHMGSGPGCGQGFLFCCAKGQARSDPAQAALPIRQQDLGCPLYLSNGFKAQGVVKRYINRCFTALILSCATQGMLQGWQRKPS